jgi:hypothetical protein
MHAYEETIRDWNTGQDWYDVPQTLKHEIAAQYLRDESFYTAAAGTNQVKFERVFGSLLADLIEARYTTPERFAEAGRKFASAAYAFIASELDDALREEWELATPDTPDVDAPAEAQARHRDFIGMVRS